MFRRRSETRVVETIVLSVIVLALCLAAIPGAALAVDAWPQSCAAARTVGPGAYGDSLSPGDGDALRVNLSRGEYLTVTLSFIAPSPNAQLRVSTFPDAPITTANGSSLRRRVSATDRARSPITYVSGDSQRFEMTPGTVSVRVYSETTDAVCLSLATVRQTAGEWRLSLASPSATTPATGLPNRSAERIDDLEARVERLNDSVAALRSTVARLHRRVEALEERTNESDKGGTGVGD